MKKILIIEDEKLLIEMYRDKFIQSGFEVITTMEAEKGFILAKKEKPDLILMDIVLKGGMDGIVTAQRICKNFDIPIIFITAFTNENIFEKAKFIEPYAYIVKPFDSSELYTNIEMALYKYKLSKMLKASEERF